MCVRVLVLLALVALLHRGDATMEKISECCKTVSTQKLPGKVTGIIPQKKNGDCVNAYVVQMDETNLFCVYVRAKWIQPHLKAHLETQRKAKASVAPSRRTLLSTLTSTPSRAPVPTSDLGSSFTSSSTAPPPTITSSSSSDESSSREFDHIV